MTTPVPAGLGAGLDELEEGCAVDVDSHVDAVGAGVGEGVDSTVSDDPDGFGAGVVEAEGLDVCCEDECSEEDGECRSHCIVWCLWLGYVYSRGSQGAFYVFLTGSGTYRHSMQSKLRLPRHGKPRFRGWSPNGWCDQTVPQTYQSEQESPSLKALGIVRFGTT